MKQTTGHHANEGALKHLLGFFHFLIKGSPAMMPIHTHVSSIAFAQPGATGFSSIKQRKREGISLAWLRRQNRASWGGGQLWGRMEPESHNNTMDYPQSTWGFPHRTTGGLDGADMGYFDFITTGPKRQFQCVRWGPSTHPENS